jgi:hypothetical protein
MSFLDVMEQDAIWLLRVVEAGFDDGGFVLLVVFVEDDEFASVDGVLELAAYGDVGGFGPGEE